MGGVLIDDFPPKSGRSEWHYQFKSWVADHCSLLNDQTKTPLQVLSSEMHYYCTVIEWRHSIKVLTHSMCFHGNSTLRGHICGLSPLSDPSQQYSTLFHPLLGMSLRGQCDKFDIKYAFWSLISMWCLSLQLWLLNELMNVVLYYLLLNRPLLTILTSPQCSKSSSAFWWSRSV